MCSAKHVTLEMFPDVRGFFEEAEYMPSSPDLGSGQISGAVSDFSQKLFRANQCAWPLKVRFQCSDFSERLFSMVCHVLSNLCICSAECCSAKDQAW